MIEEFRKNWRLPADGFERYTRTWTAVDEIIAQCEELAEEYDVPPNRVEDLRDAANEPLLETPEDEESAFMRKLAAFFDELPEGWNQRQ